MKKLALGVFGMLLCSCTAHIYNVPGENRLPVIDDHLDGKISSIQGKEYQGWLFQSGIISPEESVDTNYYIEDFHIYPVCGMALIGSAMTLGVFPVTLPHYGVATLVTESSAATTRAPYLIRSNFRYSIWESLNIFRDSSGDDVVLGRALAWAFKQNRLSPENAEQD